MRTVYFSCPFLMLLALLTGCSTPLKKAIGRDNVAEVKQLIKDGADVEEGTFVFPFTPLMDASWDGKTDCVKALLAADVDVNKQTSVGGLNALSLAVEKNHPDVVQILLDHGADINIQSTSLTPLMTAVVWGHTDCVRLLLERGADLDIKTKFSGATALSLARQHGNPEIVRLLENEPGKRAARKAIQEELQITSQLSGLSLTQRMGKFDFNREPLLAAWTGQLIETKNKELPSFVATASVEQRVALVTAVEQRLIEAQSFVVELNGQAEDALLKNQDTADFRRHIGKLQAYMAVLAEIKTMLMQS